MRKYILFVVLAVILAATVWYTRSNQSKPAAKPKTPQDQSVTQKTVATTSLTSIKISGVLVRNNPGMKPNAWFVVFDKPGSPALQQELMISSSTVCRGIASCSALESGTAVSATGNVSSSVLLAEEISINTSNK